MKIGFIGWVLLMVLLTQSVFAFQKIDEGFGGKAVLKITKKTTIVTNKNDIVTNVSFSTNMEYHYPESDIKIYEGKPQKLPNSYLKSGKIELEEIEHPIRRFDVVYFVAVPMTYYLTLNIMLLKNAIFYNSRALDATDWLYIGLNTLIMPLAAATFDYFYIERQKKIDQRYTLQHQPLDGFGFGLKYTIGF